MFAISVSLKKIKTEHMTVGRWGETERDSCRGGQRGEGTYTEVDRMRET